LKDGSVVQPLVIGRTKRLKVFISCSALNLTMQM